MDYYFYPQGLEHCKTRMTPMASDTKQGKHGCACSSSHVSDSEPFRPASVKE